MHDHCGRFPVSPAANQPLRIKTLSLIAQGTIQKIGFINLLLGPALTLPVLEITSILGNVPISEVNKITFVAQQVGQPVFEIKVIDDKVINCGYIQFNLTQIILPPTINSTTAPDLISALTSVFPTLFTTPVVPVPIFIPLQGALDVEGVRSTDDIEEFFDVEGIISCFKIETAQAIVGAFEPTLALPTLVLEFKAAVNTRILASRFVVATADVSNVEDITDFEDEEMEDEEVNEVETTTT